MNDVLEKVTRAIKSINPSAEFVLRDSSDDVNIDNDTFTIEWHVGTPISKADVKTEMDKL